jgi:hypothetical protein
MKRKLIFSLQIALIICEIPSNLMLKYWKPRNWLSRIMATWGIVVACHAAMSNKEGYYVLRFVLGAMEAGLFPGYGHLFFVKHQ